MDDYIKQRAKKWKFPWQILKDMDAQARMDYMRSGARLAVLPSLMENSPYTVPRFPNTPGQGWGEGEGRVGFRSVDP